MFKGLLVGFVLAFLLMGGGVAYYVASGRMPVAAADPPFPFERQIASLALDAHIKKQTVPPSPVPANDATFLAGAQVYKQHCAACHGLPGEPVPEFAAGMYPSPPQLFKGKGVTDDPAPETYWKVVNGIRMTGMPAFKSALTDTQAWQVSQLLAHELSASARQELVSKTSADAPSPVPAVAAPPKKLGAK